MEKTCSTCQNRNDQGICTNHESVFFGSRVEDGTCPVWENYEWEMWGGMNDMEFGEHFDLGEVMKRQPRWKETTVYAMKKNAAVAFAKGTDKMLLDAIIQKAKENGITDLYVLNEDFILSAIKEKMEKSYDAVPVVRCRECKHRNGAPGQPNILCFQMKDDDFCSYGERR